MALKTWQWALIGVGTVAGVAIVAKALSTPSQTAFAGPSFTPSAGAPDAATAAITGGTSIVRDLIGVFERRSARDAMGAKSGSGFDDKSGLTEAEPIGDVTAYLARKNAQA